MVRLSLHVMSPLQIGRSSQFTWYLRAFKQLPGMAQGICKCIFEHGCYITTVIHQWSLGMDRSEPMMVNLHSRIRRLWREHIDPDDTIKTTVVRPNPVLDRNEGPMLIPAC